MVLIVTVSTGTSSLVHQVINHMTPSTEGDWAYPASTINKENEADQAWLRMRVLAQVWWRGKEFLSSRIEMEDLPVEMGGVASSGGSVAWLYW